MGKEFKKKYMHPTRRKLVDMVETGKYDKNTTIGYTKAKEVRNIGDVWEDKHNKYEQKDGYILKTGKNSEAFQEIRNYLQEKSNCKNSECKTIKKTDKDDQKKIGKKNLMKFEQIFLGLGAEVLEFTSSALTVNADGAVRDMKKRIDKTIKDVKKSGDPKKIEKLKLELGRLKSIGGSKKIVPNEGIVFLYKGNTFKLTGTFASVNQILGIFF